MAHTPNNEFTQMIERVAGHNSGGRGTASTFVGGESITARSSSLGTEVTTELTTEERERLDAEAIRLGIMPHPEGIGAGQYHTLDDAVRAGMPVVPPDYSHMNIPAVPTSPRLPDFSKIQGLDLVQGLLYVDGMEFPMPDVDVVEFKRYAIRVVQFAIQERLAASFTELGLGIGEGTSGGTDSGMQVMWGGEETPGVLSDEEKS